MRGAGLMVAEMPIHPNAGPGRTEREAGSRTMLWVALGIVGMVAVAVVLGIAVILGTPTRSEASQATRTTVKAQLSTGTTALADRPATVTVEVVGPAAPRSLVLLVDGAAVAEADGSSGAITYTPTLGSHQAKVRVRLPDGSVADSPDLTLTATAPPTTPPAVPAPPVATKPGTCGAGCFRVTTGDVRLRPAPGTDDGRYTTFVPGSPLTVACQVAGPVPAGQSTGVWNRLATGGYVHDAFVDTPKDDAGLFTKGLDRC